ncbi:YcdB/YcdC domain-containing protein [Anaerosolibacter sp.]|uniref:YcdB/YcdC domain-containing protein n=1 Tax=Anaerosolibacter sp. TaxID=1872527 RepID=UPI0039F07020
MKKLISMVLVLVLLLGMMIPAFGEEKNNGINEENLKITKDEAKEIAIKRLKEYLDVQVDEKKFQTRMELRSDYEDPQNSLWHINWDFNDNAKSIHINVSVDGSDGSIRSLSQQEYIHSQERVAIATITEEQGKQLAEKFVQKFYPEIYKQVKLVGDGAINYGPGSYYSSNYSFRYVQTVNGLSFEPNYMTVEVDGMKGKITGFSYRWRNGLTFPGVEEVIGEEKAKTLFEKELKMELRYMPHRPQPYDYNSPIKTIKLAYYPTFTSGDQVDAKEGKFLIWPARTPEEKMEKDITTKQKEEIFNSATKIETRTKEMDESQAAQIMKEQLEKTFGEGYDIESLRYMENEDYWESSGKKAWSGQFVKKDGDTRYNGRGQITIDALTGELINLTSHNWRDMEEKFEPVLSWEEGYDKAIESIKEYFPHKIKEIETKSAYIKSSYLVNGREVEQPYYYFSFPRLVSGIAYPEDAITVELDRKTGQIQSIRCMWNDEAAFPNPADRIKEDKAQEIFFEDYGPNLIYTLYNSSSDPQKPVEEVKLVYRLNRDTAYMYMPYSNVDALTGEKIDYQGGVINSKGNSFKEKIKGHWAEKEMNILANQGIIDVSQFDMDKEITLMEVIKIMVNAKGYETYRLRGVDTLKFGNYQAEDSEYKYLQMAVLYGILENKSMVFDGEKKISREELANLMVRLLRYENVAKIQGIYTLPYSDKGEVNPEYLGAVALCTGLEIINGQDGKIRPKDNATMVEMAIAVYKAMENIRPIR